MASRKASFFGYDPNKSALKDFPKKMKVAGVDFETRSYSADGTYHGNRYHRFEYTTNQKIFVNFEKKTIRLFYSGYNMLNNLKMSDKLKRIEQLEAETLKIYNLSTEVYIRGNKSPFSGFTDWSYSSGLSNFHDKINKYQEILDRNPDYFTIGIERATVGYIEVELSEKHLKMFEQYWEDHEEELRIARKKRDAARKAAKEAEKKAKEEAERKAARSQRVDSIADALALLESEGLNVVVVKDGSSVVG